MIIELKGKPVSVNNLYATMCRGNFPSRYMTKKGKEIKESYQLQAKLQWKRKPIKDEDISVTILLYFADKRKNDIDNFNKGILDSLTGICWVDDSQIRTLYVIKEYDNKNPRVVIDIN